MEAAIEAALARMREYPDKVREVLRDLRAKNDKGAKIEAWKEDQVNKFAKVLVENVKELEAGYLQGSLSKTAWTARNLMELSIWIRYCNLSDEHGKRFRLDGARDLIGFFKALKGYHGTKIASEIPRMDAAEAELELIAKSEFGVASLGTSFVEVRNAADEVGETRYKDLNKLCSKFAHPTAWIIAATDWPEFSQFAMMFLFEGRSIAFEALDTIRGFVQKAYPMTSEIAP
jgi:hypothetical protein